jgi:2-keto-4-pentenoate hydratase
MTSPSATDQLADELFLARRTTGRFVDLSSHGLSRSDGLALQLRVADRYAAEGDGIGGWKVPFTSGPQRDRMGAGYRPFGFVPASRVLRSGSSVPLSAFNKPGIEIELCLRVDEHGTVGVAAAFELIDKRTAAGADDATVLADAASNWGIVLGEFVAIPDVPLTSLRATLRHAGAVVEEYVPGDTMDDPIVSLDGLRSLLAEYGRELSAGQGVITGSITKAAVDGPGSWVGEVDGLGSIELTFT